MENIISGKYRITKNYSSVIQTINTSYSLNKNNQNFYNENLTINIVSAIANPVVTSVTIYYNQNITFNNYISAFLWSNNIIQKQVKTDNKDFNILCTSGLNTLISTYENLNNSIISLSAYTKNLDMTINLSTVQNLSVSTVIPQFYTNSIYYSYEQVSTLFLKNYVYFEENQNFGTYLFNTLISSNTYNISNFYSQIILNGLSSNQSYLDLSNKNFNCKKTSIKLPIYYSLNIKNNEPYISSTIILYPCFTKLNSNIYLVTNNLYDTYYNLISSNLNYYNCTKNNTQINILNNEYYMIDKSGNLTSTSIPGNFSLIYYNINSTIDNIYQTNIINKNNILSCLHLNSYIINQDKIFDIPILKNQTPIYTIKLADFIFDKGNNDIFDFNLINNNAQIIQNISSTISNYNLSTIISTQILDYKFIQEPISGNYKFNNILWNISSNLQLSLYNNNSYNLYDLLSSNNLNNEFILTHISANFLDNNYIDNLSSNYDDLMISTNLPLNYIQEIASAYSTNNYYISNNILNSNITLFGKMINRTNNNMIYIYGLDELSEFQVTSSILKVNDDINTKIFEQQNIILNLSNKIELTDSIKNKLLTSIVSSYIQNNNLYIYKYTILSNIINNCACKFKMYYNLIDNIYLKIPTYIIGSIVANGKKQYYYTINNINAKINTDTYCFQLSKNITGLDVSNFILSTADFNTIEQLLYIYNKFNFNQYIEFQDRINSTSALYVYNKSDIMYDNYNINIKDNIIYKPAEDFINDNIFNYGITLYNNCKIENSYINYVQFMSDSLSTINNLYISYIPNISTQLTEEYRQQIYPQIIANYYRTIITTPKSSTTELYQTVLSGTIFKSNIQNMYSSLQNIINNIPCTSIFEDNLSCKYENNNFYIQANLSSIDESKYNFYFTTDTENIGMITLFINKN